MIYQGNFTEVLSIQKMVLRQPHIHMMKCEFIPLSYTVRTNLPTWVIELNVSAKTIKFLGKNTGG